MRGIERVGKSHDPLLEALNEYSFSDLPKLLLGISKAFQQLSFQPLKRQELSFESIRFVKDFGPAGLHSDNCGPAVARSASRPPPAQP